MPLKVERVARGTLARSLILQTARGIHFQKSCASTEEIAGAFRVFDLGRFDRAVEEGGEHLGVLTTYRMSSDCRSHANAESVRLKATRSEALRSGDKAGHQPTDSSPERVPVLDANLSAGTPSR